MKQKSKSKINFIDELKWKVIKEGSQYTLW